MNDIPLVSWMRSMVMHADPTAISPDALDALGIYPCSTLSFPRFMNVVGHRYAARTRKPNGSTSTGIE
jgi:hypothetical protein